MFTIWGAAPPSLLPRAPKIGTLYEVGSWPLIKWTECYGILPEKGDPFSRAEKKRENMEHSDFRTHNGVCSRPKTSVVSAGLTKRGALCHNQSRGLFQTRGTHSSETIWQKLSFYYEKDNEA